MNQSGFPLMNELVSSMNIDRAIEKVKKNKGAPGIDDMTVSEIKSHLNKYRRPFVQKLREGPIAHNQQNVWKFLKETARNEN